MSFLVLALLLGLRHATDPDHLVAVSTLVASHPEDGGRRARRLGLAWGLGHATTLVTLGLPIILLRASIPERVGQAAELSVGLMIAALALRLLWRRRAGRTATRSPVQAFGIGVVHGMGGSAGVTVVLLAGAPAPGAAAAALLLFAAATAMSMAILSSSFGHALTRRPIERRLHALTPAMAAASLVFGAWYALGAVDAVHYPL